MKKPKNKRARDERGVSLAEVMIGLVMLTSALLGLTGASGLALHTTIRSRQDIEIWTAVQWKADSLLALGPGNVSPGAAIVQGYPMGWTVSGTNPVRIDLMVYRPKLTTGAMTVDTLTMYLAN